VPTAEWSKKTAVENQDNISDTFITGESDLPSFAVCKFKIGRGPVIGNFASVHEVPLICRTSESDGIEAIPYSQIEKSMRGRPLVKPSEE